MKRYTRDIRLYAPLLPLIIIYGAAALHAGLFVLVEVPVSEDHGIVHRYVVPVGEFDQQIEVVDEQGNYSITDANGTVHNQITASVEGSPLFAVAGITVQESNDPNLYASVNVVGYVPKPGMQRFRLILTDILGKDHIPPKVRK
ncbi:MAG: hypothetical protein ACYTEQ_30980 [Planctomycetota bacterium]|jgi:hypothetical protein